MVDFVISHFFFEIRERSFPHENWQFLPKLPSLAEGHYIYIYIYCLVKII